MKNIVSTLILTASGLFSGFASAHFGHGEHTDIYASGQSHPMIGSEHLLTVLLSVVVVYLALRLIRK